MIIIIISIIITIRNSGFCNWLYLSGFLIVATYVLTNQFWVGFYFIS